MAAFTAAPAPTITLSKVIIPMSSQTLTPSLTDYSGVVSNFFIGTIYQAQNTLVPKIPTFTLYPNTP